MRSSPTPAEKSSSLLKSATFAEHLSELLHMGRKTLFIMSSFILTYRLHGSSCDDDCSALLQDLGKVDRRVQQQELNAALRQRSCILKQTWHFLTKGLLKQLFLTFAIKTPPWLFTTTLPSVLLLVRAIKKLSTCIMGDADGTFSASTGPCWSVADTAYVKAKQTNLHF